MDHSQPEPLLDLAAQTAERAAVVPDARETAVLADQVHRQVDVLVPVHRRAVMDRQPPTGRLLPVVEPQPLYGCPDDLGPLLVGEFPAGRGVLGGQGD
jgi:hypothetical protein